MYRKIGKRLFDLSLTVPALVILAPGMAVLAFLVRIRLGRPILFWQVRPGLHNKAFMLCKFRTMSDEYDENGILLPDGFRMLRLGMFLRKFSLDELPALLNVIKGDMSLVGPRPLLLRYLKRYTHEQARRHQVKPGITGWAQVNGRNAITWEEKFILDVWYVDHVSFWLDVKILAMTAWKVIKREGINQPGHATMKEFMGRGL